ncbi:hypothetical protein D9757_012830 [Collybiopsis confluens]|uniref:Uncharacterized protein n=1 Tax=Collybiopsis confluens TaxID=2823264 RepID=A0A8H5CZG9_9AGAR|nr:hypothetical protein D9757_012830 [Collybiopsis confluens]
MDDESKQSHQSDSEDLNTDLDICSPDSSEFGVTAAGNHGRKRIKKGQHYSHLEIGRIFIVVLDLHSSHMKELNRWCSGREIPDTMEKREALGFFKATPDNTTMISYSGGIDLVLVAWMTTYSSVGHGAIKAILPEERRSSKYENEWSVGTFLTGHPRCTLLPLAGGNDNDIA